MNFGWKTRVGLVLSAVWLCLVFLVADEYRRLGQVLGVGLLPLVVIWGIAWSVVGWKSQRPEKPTTPEIAQLEAKAKRSLRIRTGIAVIAILGLGTVAANFQFNNAGNENSGQFVAQWFGEWLVYGLIAYAILRAVPKIPPGSPAVIAALIIVGAVNYKTHSAIAEDRHALESLAKATPLLNKFQSGVLVSDQEVRDARVGMMEPLMLAQATYSREVLAITATYEKGLSELQMDLMLTPSALASPNIRAQTRKKLKLWQHVTAEYKIQIDAATARGKVGIEAAQSQMPEAISDSASKGFERASSQLSDYMEKLVKSELEASQAIAEIIDLMDANQGGYFVDKGPPTNLLFRDAGTLARYRELMDAVMSASQRQQEARARLLRGQADNAAKLGELFKR